MKERNYDKETERKERKQTIRGQKKILKKLCLILETEEIAFIKQEWNVICIR